MIVRNCFCTSSVTSSSSNKSSAEPLIAVSGVLNSWETEDKKLSFSSSNWASSAFCAASSAIKVTRWASVRCRAAAIWLNEFARLPISSLVSALALTARFPAPSSPATMVSLTMGLTICRPTITAVPAPTTMPRAISMNAASVAPSTDDSAPSSASTVSAINRGCTSSLMMWTILSSPSASSTRRTRWASAWSMTLALVVMVSRKTSSTPAMINSSLWEGWLERNTASKTLNPSCSSFTVSR